MRKYCAAMNWIERLNAQNAQITGGARVLRWSYQSQLPDNVPHRHTFFEVCLVGGRGNALWSVGEAQFSIGPGDLIVAKPGAIHQISETRDLELFWVSFDVPNPGSGGEIADLWSAFEASPCTLCHRQNALFALWTTLQIVAAGEEIAGKNAQIEAIQNALLLSIAQNGAGNLAPLGEAPQSDLHHSARLAARYLRDNLGRKISLDEVAAHVHLSPRHLSRLFAAFTGVSPAIYLETARLDRARHLLRASNRPIKEIAASIGIEDVHYFHRLFSKRNGVSPAQFRRESARDVQIIHKDGALV